MEKINAIEVRWQHGCPVCRSIDYRSSWYKAFSKHEYDFLMLTCNACGYSESVQDDSKDKNS
jgi:predicted nucleic-acid-binding Zn-ribbon protein